MTTRPRVDFRDSSTIIPAEPPSVPPSVMIYDVKDKFFEAYIIAFRSQGVDGNRGEMRGGSKSGGNSAGGGGGGRTNSGGKPL